MKFDRLNRRMFLQGASGAVLGIPFLSSLLPRNAAAQTGAPKRFVAIKSYSTQNIVDWYPSGFLTEDQGTVQKAPSGGYTARAYGGDGGGNGKDDGTCALNLDLAESSGRHPGSGQSYTGKWAPLSDFVDTGVSRILGTEFNPYLSKMLLLRGLDFLPDTNHNDGGMLGNYSTSLDPAPGVAVDPTIDQVLAASSAFYSAAPVGPRILHMTSGGANTFSVDASGAQAVAHVDPRTAFEDAFQFVTPSGSEDPNKRLIDRVYADYLAIRQHPRLGSADRTLMERHISFVAELQNRLDSGSTTGCQPPNAPGNLQLNGADAGDIRTFFQNCIDVAVAALACDATRIVTLNVYRAIGQRAGAEAGFQHSCAACDGRPANATDWHEAAHDWGIPAERNKVVTINEWIARAVFLEIVRRLDAIDDGNGQTMLDNSVVMWGNELGMNHLNWSVPVVMAGSAGGHFDTGRYIDYIDWNRNVRFSQENGMVIEGVPYNRLLVSLLQAFGLSPADYETAGRPGYGEHRTLRKGGAHAIDYDLSTLGSPLPGLRG